MDGMMRADLQAVVAPLNIIEPMAEKPILTGSGGRTSCATHTNWRAPTRARQAWMD